MATKLSKTKKSNKSRDLSKSITKPRKALGRGINALLGNSEDTEQSPASKSSRAQSNYPGGTSTSQPNFLEIDIENIKPNSSQPRTAFPEAELAELTQSIRMNGIVQPIIVREKNVLKKTKGADRVFEIVAGERRWRAAQRAELKRIPAIIRKVTDDKMLEIALIENIQRQELNPIEEARAYQKLIDDLKLTQADVAERVGKTRTFVANYLRLLHLPKSILALIKDKSLSVGHAKALLSVSSSRLQKELANEILSKGMSVRDAERAAKRPARSKSSANKSPKTSAPDANVRKAEVKLRRRYATQVKILSNRDPNKNPNGGDNVDNGKIVLEYYGTKDLDRIFQLLMGK